jgi:hypothetical protein
MNSKDTTYKPFMLYYYLLIAAVMLFGMIPTPLSADNGNVPPELQAKLFLTALTYDKHLEKRAESQLNIGIVYFTDAPKSKKEAENFSKTLEAFKEKKISGRNFNTTLLAYNGNGDLKQKIVDEQIDAVFIAKGEKHQVKKLIKLTQAEKILSGTSKAEYVATCGVTMAVGLKDNKPKIYLNISSAKREGADFSAKFLRVAEIVDEESK